MKYAMRSLLLALGIVGAMLVRCGAEESASLKLNVQVDKPGITVSPTLYGIFFEEINLAGDGGLYAELLRNRSFEETDKLDYWTLVKTGKAEGDIVVDRANPMSEKNPRSLRLNVKEVGDGSVGVANDGYWGIPVQEGEVYDFSIAARASDGFNGPLTVRLESQDGTKVYAEDSISALTPEWKTFKIALTAKATDWKARLVVSISQKGSVYLDMVSLFPRKTWKGRANGLRTDLAEKLVGLQPSFVRFPGGCWVEGEIMANATRWKKTIGDVSDRWSQWNIWQYYSTNGLGFHEYLQLCEDLGAEPLFVFNCGMAHQNHIAMDQMSEFVQDALDAIEYANGPADSRWGAVRAKAGHPVPFNLKFVEIGNENGGGLYNERYKLFYDAIKAKYPTMRTVACDWSGRPTSRPIDLIDEHYYYEPEFFINNAHRYDTYDRKGPKIYVGEYAVTKNCGNGNLRGAIGEAAFMTGMERNSDIVEMASYAPLFANVEYKRWNPNLIYFDNHRNYGTPSYYAQKLFSENRGDVIVPATLEAGETKPETKKGAVGVGTWMTKSEYKDVKVVKGDEVLYDGASSKEQAKAWKFGKGEWKFADGALRQSDNGEERFATVGNKDWSDYTLTLKARKISGSEGFLVLFHVQSEDTFVWWNIGGWGNSRDSIEVTTKGSRSVLGGAVDSKVEDNRWYDLKVEVSGTKIRCFIDGKLVHDVEYPRSEPLHAVAGLSKDRSELILKVVNSTFAKQTAKLNLNGAPKLASEAKTVVLTSEKGEDENSLDNPKRVAPVESVTTGVGATFTHEFPANSVTIFRVKIK